MSEGSETRGGGTAQGGAYAWFVVFVLILAYTVSFIDRQILTLMVGPIRAKLDINATQLSLLHGFAFAIFYTTLGLPIGRLVDRRRRTAIVAGGIVIWSVMTATCGLARNFTQLFIARIGVGVGEAALSPGAYSLISDYFPAKQRAKALSLYISAAYVGAGLATIAGGALIGLVPGLEVPGIGHLEPWQVVFIAVGVPGLLVALLVLSLREPERRGTLPGAHPSLGAVFAYMSARRAAYFYLIVGYSISGLIWNGSLAWLPTFFIRTYGWSAGEVGLRYGIAVMVSGLAGVVLGGGWATRLRERGLLDANIRIGLISLAVLVPAGIAAALVSDGMTALLLWTLFLFGCALPYGAAAAALQEITPNQMRGQVSAIYLFCLSMFGMGLGPTLVASFTDHVFGRDDAVGLSLALTIAVAAPVSALLLQAARAPYRDALQRDAF